MTTPFLSRDIWPQLTQATRSCPMRCVKPGKRREAMTSKRPTLPRVLLAQLRLEDWSQSEHVFHDAGMLVVKRRSKHRRAFELDSFRYSGRCPFRRDDVIVQVTDEGNSGVLVTPPGNVLELRTRRVGNRPVSFVYLERPAQRRRQLKSVARVLECTQERLRHDGIVRDSSFAQALLNTWAATS